MTVTIPCDGPLDVSKTLARYHLWGVDPANLVTSDRFRRVLRVRDRLYGYEVSWAGPPDDVRLRLSIGRTRNERVLAAAIAEVRHIFGLDADLPGFYRMAKGDPALCTLVDPLYGLRPTLTPSTLEMLVGAVCAQQVNLAFAFALRGRLVRQYGEAVTVGGETVHAFPSAAALARARVSRLREMQFSVRKAEYIVGIARAMRSGALDEVRLAAGSNAAAVICLTGQRGLGLWTAEWFLARCLGRGDVCPAGDLAVRKAFAHYYHGGRDVSEGAIRRRARAWGPYQSLAVHYLLAGLRRSVTIGGGT
jgi:DNA-3-methyladenine glycosylase II